MKKDAGVTGKEETALGTDPAEQDSIDNKVLLVVFCDRLNQIIDRRIDVIRSGRGRINDFKDKLGIHYTTAHRLLSGDALPNVALLHKIAKIFDVTEHWLLGGGASDIDAQVEMSGVKIHLFRPRSPDSEQTITVPVELFPEGFDSAQLVWNSTVSGVGDPQEVVVKKTAEPAEGRVHLLYDPVTERTFLRRINVVPSTAELLCFSLETGAVERIKTTEVVFGQTTKAEKLSIVGPVVARVTFGFKGD
jgi:transcriptional regulator with XRE-family HTH domain